MKESLNEAHQKIKALEEAAVKSSLKTTNLTYHLNSLAINNNWIKLVSEIELEETFKCTRMELFKTLTQPKLIQVFTQNPVIMAGDAKAGVEFTLLDGNIFGTYKCVTRYSLISQSWRLKSWPAGHFAEVAMQITPTKDGAKLNVTLKGVPNEELISTRDCWQRYYFHAIKQTICPDYIL